MTEADAREPRDPQSNPPAEVRADPETWPAEWTLRDEPVKAPAAKDSAASPASPGGTQEFGAGTEAPPPAPAPVADPAPQALLAPAPSAGPPPVPPLAPAMVSAQIAPRSSGAAHAGDPRAPEPAQPASHERPLPPPFSPPPVTPQPEPANPSAPGAPPPPPPAPPLGGYPGDPPVSRPGSAWPMAAHLTSLIDLGFSFCFVGFIGPLVIWLARKDEDPETDWHGRESLNFQINLLILWVAALPLYCLCGLGALIHLLLPVYKIVLVILASIQAADGKRYRYPFTLRLLND